MKRLKKVIELSVFLPVEGAFESENRFVIKNKNYTYTLCEENKRIILKIDFKKKFAGEALKAYAAKMTLVNSCIRAAGFELDENGYASIYKAFSAGETEDNIASAAVKYYQNVDSLVVV